MTSLISIVAPVYNEARTLPEFIDRIVRVAAGLGDRYQFEFIIVDDGSTDNSLEVARSLLSTERRLRVVELRRNFGQTAALQAGLSAAKGEIIISMDSDLQHFPEEIPLFVEKIEQGYDLVCGWRHQRQESILRRWPSRAANWIIRRVSGLKIHDVGTTFRAYRRDLVDHLTLLGEQHRFVPALALLAGARMTEVPIENIDRPAGRSNYGLMRTFNVMLDIIFLFFAARYLARPLKAFGKIAMVLGTAGVGIAGGLLVYAWVTGFPGIVRAHGGWFLLASLLLLAALQILLTGIVAEILVRIYYSVSRDHGYIVRREWTPDR